MINLIIEHLPANEILVLDFNEDNNTYIVYTEDSNGYEEEILITKDEEKARREFKSSLSYFRD